MEYTTTTEQETEDLAETLAARLKPGDVLAFRGGLGAGKTAFVRGLARGLHVSGQVSSPTFALVHEYGGAVPLYHFDMYRVEDWPSLYSTGFFDYLDSGGILAVEWSENIENALPEGTITVAIETLGGDTRRIIWEE
jgi:tRNA threonylcarbamoyladenosine biosynthesis protein TsaE